VVPYATSVAPITTSELFLARTSYGFFIMLVVLICGNVALLLFARAATREGELAIRNALGASRGRIVAQLFAEALVLGGVAAAAALGAAGVGVRLLVGAFEMNSGQRLPFWYHADLSPRTVLYATGLTVLGAAIAGVLPGLKVTRGLQARLRQAAAGAGGLTFGGVWTAVIVAQIAVTLAFPVVAFNVARDAADTRAMVADFPAAEFLSARIALDREPPPGADTSFAAFVVRRQATVREVERRLRAEPGVVGVTLAERLPRMEHPPQKIEVDSGGAAPEDPKFPGGYRTSSAAVDADYFDVLGAPVRAGRAFHAGDLAADARVVIVNASFVRLVLGGRNPIGRHLRYRYGARGPRAGGAEPGPWHEIVGVVPDLGMSKATDPKVAGFYHPLAADVVAPLHIAVHVRGGDAAAFAPRLRAVAAAVDPRRRRARAGAAAARGAGGRRRDAGRAAAADGPPAPEDRGGLGWRGAGEPGFPGRLPDELHGRRRGLLRRAGRSGARRTRVPRRRPRARRPRRHRERVARPARVRRTQPDRPAPPLSLRRARAARGGRGAGPVARDRRRRPRPRDVEGDGPEGGGVLPPARGGWRRAAPHRGARARRRRGGVRPAAARRRRRGGPHAARRRRRPHGHPERPRPRVRRVLGPAPRRGERGGDAPLHGGDLRR
jgi:hypothetical protein